ncbi:glycosyltransferase family 2 protein [Metabacillus arenae]|uniref:Glycosyltransferase family 2 protein n=1 Tax=Metabacillus arenae TaxID=2771434 RepID=A0A926RYF9_9BACI|nr:glycosyltransferase family A protein [Metabacillus arenae]MBD1382036.1 glycosyltransferase family 2 protein [Metabacillus arenae]
MMDPMFTILVPTYNHGSLLRYALASILQQSCQNFEVFIICDGAMDEGVEIAWQYARKDPRFRVLDRPKGTRHGEAYRHEALQTAKGKFVCYLSDDDLWFPDHLQHMEEALLKADFVHSRYVAVLQKEKMVAIHESLEDTEIRDRMLKERYNIFGPTIAGHRLDTYRRLPEGWSPGPENVWSDLNMWRKFLKLEKITFHAILAVTALILPSNFRTTMSLKEREAETAFWAKRISCLSFRTTIQDTFFML